MSKSSKGILRSQPRYSSAPDVNHPVSGSAPNVSHVQCHEAVPTPATSITMNSRDVIERFQTDNDQIAVSASTSHPENKNHMTNDGKKKTRSLADLVRCSVNLNNEARGIINNNEGEQTRERKNHGDGLEKKLETLSLNQKQREVEESVPDATTVCSNLPNPSDEGHAVAYVDCANFKLVTNDKNERILLEETDGTNKELSIGRRNDIGDETQHVVTFSEYEETGDDIAAHATTTRERLEQRVADHEDIEFVDYVEDDLENSFKEDEKKEQDSDTDSTSSGGSTEDDEILAELGLTEFITVNDAYDDDDDLFSADCSRCGEENAEPEPRSFRVIWDTLSQWVTPSSIQLVKQYQEERERIVNKSIVTLQPSSSKSHDECKAIDDPSVRNTVDVGASRRAGIMSMLKLNVVRSLSELKKANKTHTGGDRKTIAPASSQALLRPAGASGKARQRSKPKIAIFTESDVSSISSNTNEVGLIDQRLVERRLANLIGTFNSTGPAANLNMKLWRGMTTILIAIAFPVFSEVLDLDLKQESKREKQESNDANRNALPPSIGSLGMTLDEFRYLTKSAFMSLG